MGRVTGDTPYGLEAGEADGVALRCPDLAGLEIGDGLERSIGHEVGKAALGEAKPDEALLLKPLQQGGVHAGAHLIHFPQIVEEKGQAIDFDVLIHAGKSANGHGPSLKLAGADLAHDALVIAHDTARIESQLHPPLGALRDGVASGAHGAHPTGAIRGQGGDLDHLAGLRGLDWEQG